MKKLIFILLMGISLISYSQPVDPVDGYDRTQYGSSWIFEYQPIRMNELRIDNKMAIDSNGRIWWYNNTIPTLGELLIGNGTYYTELPIGTAGQVLSVAGGTAVWAAAGGGGVTSIATTSPITGGTITSTGTLGIGGLTTFGTAGQLIKTNAGATGFEYFTPTYLTSEVDGSTTNEVQNLSYDAVNREVDISLSGTSAVIPLAVDDGATKGLASFAAADFTATAGNIVIDYTNGQSATTGQKGFLPAADFTTFAKATGFTLAITGSQNTVADATTYYSGMIIAGTGTTADINNVLVPINCTLKSVYISMITGGTLATTETSTWAVRKNNTTDITISTAIVNTAAKNNFNVTGLSTAFVAGDYVELKWTTTTWVTNPSNVRWTAILYFEAN